MFNDSENYSYEKYLYEDLFLIFFPIYLSYYYAAKKIKSKININFVLNFFVLAKSFR